MIRIGNIELDHGLMLAPMAGFSDHAMRKICHGYGCEYAVTEMVSAKAVVFGDKKTARLARIMADEGPVALQIFGSEPSVMAEAAGILSFPMLDGVAPAAIDINMGCPVPKIFNNGEGSSLMKKPALIYDIVRAVSQTIDIPCTVKMRLGVDPSNITLRECAIAAEEAGAQLLTVHGRTRVEMYAGKARFEEIENVKKDLHIPVIANGDITSSHEAIAVLRQTGADGIAIGRGAVGNPFVFAEIVAALEGRDYIAPSLDERIATALEQLSLAIEEKGETAAVLEARKQIALYFRSFRGAAELRAEINRATTLDDVKSAFGMIFK